MRKLSTVVIALSCALTFGQVVGAAAQVYPSHPIKMVVPTTAGGPTDTIARIMADGMRGPLGQSIIIENVPGASGSLGVGRVAKAAPDGYTLGLGNLPWYVFNGAIYDLPYDFPNAFDPVSLITRDPMILVGRKDLPAKDLKELIGWLKENPGKALAGTAGAGSVGHVFGINFERATGTKLQFVPFRGFAEATTDLMGGHIDLIFGLAAGFLPQVQAGTIKAYAVFEKTRLATAPEIVTADEAGAPGLFMSGWHGFFVPKGTPKNIVATLNAAAVSALGDPTVRQRLADIGQKSFPHEELTPEALGAYRKAEIEKWWPVIKAAGIRAE
jgi:tripartite-type tricarboxylate transporter receptor subunit TctC